MLSMPRVIYPMFFSQTVKTPTTLWAQPSLYTVIAQVEGFAVLRISMFSLLTTLLYILTSEQKIDPEAKLSIKSLVLIITKPART